MNTLMRRAYEYWAIACFVSLLLVFFPASSVSQPPTVLSRDAIRKAIENEAMTDAKHSAPLDTKPVVTEYEHDAIAAGMQDGEIISVYKKAYFKQQDAMKPGPLSDLFPKLGWLAAILLFLLMLFRKAIEEAITSALNAVKKRIFDHYAGSHFVLRFTLRRYRTSLLEKYRRLHIPFRQDEGLDMRDVYVPLKVAGSQDTELVEATDMLATHRRLIVVGPPGSGKSMLLRRIALSYAEGSFHELPEHPIPVLLELHRLYGSTLTLEQHLVEELKRNNFQNGERFIAHNLQHGALMLLLDGLDEVNSSERARVVQQIKDVLTQHERCRVVITCRSAVYRDEFVNTSDRTLEIVEFTDQQIRSFLRLWWAADRHANKPIAEDKSVEHLIQTLDVRPPIKALARNPLLLTIIAYLYTGTRFVLPHSRAQFYRKSTDVLLELADHHKGLANAYEELTKRSVLQHLAYVHQVNADQGQQDRRSIPYDTVLEEVKKVLPGLNLKPDDDAKPLLKEIVDRSGLLLLIDGGERYQFAHLTLQEYFAAAQLIGRAEELITLFHADRGGWRETVKLWCGLATNSTDLIRAVYTEDPITAFECLADARQVEADLADTIVEEFKERLGRSADDDAVPRAMGAVASSLHARGEPVFQFLKQALADESEPMRQLAAANALSYTNQPQAAMALAAAPLDQQSIQAALTRMGDVAIPALAQHAAQGAIRALDQIRAIGTPRAAEALVDLLYSSNENLPASAAWQLAALLPQPGIEEALARFPLTEEQRRMPYYDWVWQPFVDEDADNSLIHIAGRVAYLLDHCPDQSVPSAPLPLDLRLVIPLCAVCKQNQVAFHDFTKRKPSQELIEVVSRMTGKDMQGRISVRDLKRALSSAPASRTPGAIDDVQVLLLESCDISSSDMSLQYLLDCMSPNHRVAILCSMVKKDPIPTSEDWRNVFRPSSYDFNRSWHSRVIWSMVGAISIIGLIQIMRTLYQSQTLYSWQSAILGASAIMVLAFWVWLIMEMRRTNGLYPVAVLALGCGPTGGILIVIDSYRDEEPIDGLVENIFFLSVIFVFNLPSITYFYFASKAALHFLALGQVVSIWVLLHTIGLLLWGVGLRRQRAARNPLHGILEAQTSNILHAGSKRSKGLLQAVSKILHRH